MNCTYRHCDTELTGKQKKFCSINCKNKHHVSLARKRLKVRAVEYMGGQCARCGYDSHPAALDFHHRDPSEKDFKISNGNTIAWDKVKVELDKCELLCANCHRIEHADIGE